MTAPTLTPIHPGPEADRAGWLLARRSCVGASDSAAVCGLSPYSDPLSVYLDKKGLLPGGPMSEPQRWGLLHEPVMAAEFSRREGVAVLPSPGLLRSAEHPWLGCTPDGLVPGRDAVLQLKTSRGHEGWGPEGTDQIPDHYMVQVQHEMLVAGASRAYLAVLIAGSDFRVYECVRHPELLGRLVQITGDFWRGHVEAGVPPPPDWSLPYTAEIVALAFPPDPSAHLSLGPEDAEVVGEYARLGAEIGEFDRRRKALRAHIIERLGRAGTGHLPDGRRVVHSVRTRAAYQVAESTYSEVRVLSTRKRKEDVVHDEA